MNKNILSALLILTFSVYVLFVQSGGTDALYIASNKKDGTVIYSKDETLPPTERNPAPQDTPVKITTSTVQTKTAPRKTSQKPKPTPAPAPALKPVTAPALAPTPKPVSKFKDGQYIGISADAYYGNVQVKAIIQNGKITDVQFLDHPQDRQTSVDINDYAMPYLISEAIQAQSANVDTVSGASETSGAFRESLSSALAEAQNHA